MNASATTISRRDKSRRAAGFERLRAQGIELLQRTSGQTWTDHNLHDPGITMLEALCYALTEIVFRSEFTVEDLLADVNGRIDYDALSLHAPQDALPCGCTTTSDVRRLLLDHVEGLDDVQLERPPAPPAAKPPRKSKKARRRARHQARSADGAAVAARSADPPGLYTLCLKLADATPELLAQRKRAALAAYRAERPLGDDIHLQARSVRHALCFLHADIEFFGSHEAAEVLAEVYHQAAIFIDRATRLHSRRELIDRGLSLEEVYDGPVVERGFAADQGDPLDRQSRLYIGDLVQHVTNTVPGVHQVRRFWLETEDGRHTAESLPWGDAEWALCLCLPGDERHAAHGVDASGAAGRVRVKMFRRTQEVPVDAHELQRRVQDLKAADRARSMRQKDALTEEEAAQMPTGTHRPPGRYRSVQHDFPAVYGLGIHGVPPSAGAQRIARADQLRGYLMLFEQVIANGRAQTAHLGELFSLAGGSRKTYWWEVLDEDSVPGAGRLLADDATLEREVLEPLDRAATRKHHLLDHLLGLHGEDLSQNAMRQYCGHLDGAEQDALLIERKTSYLRDIVRLLRYRARGFDYSQPLWTPRGRDNFSTMARRAGLMLGFKHDHPRALTRLLRLNRLDIVETPPRAAVLASDAAEDAEALLVARPMSDAVPLASEPARRARRERLSSVGVVGGQPLPGSLLRAGCAHDGYRLVRGVGTLALALRDAEDGRWWQLASFDPDDEQAAIAAARTLRDAMLRFNDYLEGLHLVEHLLLRPLAGAATAHPELAVAADFFELRITAVLPDFTVRTRQRGFKLLAEETLRINCPAHLNLRVLWLDYPRLCRFEDDYGTWLRLRRELAHDADEAAILAVDVAAQAVIGHLPPYQPSPNGPTPPVLYDAVDEDDG